MIHERINFTPDGKVNLVTYVQDLSDDIISKGATWQPAVRPAVLILPGGGYTFCSDREAEPVAFPFLCAGFNVFVLRYSLGEDSAFPAPLDDVSKAVWEIRRRAAEWHVDPDRIAVGGFSAGGSLTTILGTQWNTPGLAERLGMPEGGNKPNAIFPVYAVTDISRIGDNPRPGMAAILRNKTPQLNTHLYVGSHTPPTFIMHTVEDTMVPPRNAMLFAQACLDNNVPVEMHLYQYGHHGVSLNNDQVSLGMAQPVNVSTWVPLCIAWLKTVLG